MKCFNFAGKTLDNPTQITQRVLLIEQLKNIKRLEIKQKYTEHTIKKLNTKKHDPNQKSDVI